MSTAPTPTIDDGFNVIRIPYGQPEIVTSTTLNLATCVLYMPLRLLICVICRIGVGPQYIRNHRRRAPHYDVCPISDEQVDSLIREYNIHQFDTFKEHNVDCPAVPGIPYSSGFRCSFPGCNHGRESLQTMSRHVRDKHKSTTKSYPPIECNVQTLFSSNATRYPVVVPNFTPSPATQPSALTYAAATYRAIFDVHPELEDRAHLSPFLAKYDWVKIVKEYSTQNINNWVSLPTDNARSGLSRLEATVKGYYNIIIEAIADSSSHVTALRWVKSATG
jgi:hypothetical protein